MILYRVYFSPICIFSFHLLNNGFSVLICTVVALVELVATVAVVAMVDKVLLVPVPRRPMEALGDQGKLDQDSDSDSDSDFISISKLLLEGSYCVL